MKDKKNFKLGLIQMAMTPDLEENLARAINWIREAHDQGAEVICLPELFRSQYFCQHEDVSYFNLAESIPGSSTEALREIAKELCAVIIAPIFERRAAGVYHNSVAVIDKDGLIIGIYRKMHIPDDPAYYEKFYFTPGDLGFRVFETQIGSIGTLICWDQWYPEGARISALKGASILFYPTAIGWHPDEKLIDRAAQLDAWRTIQRAHAIANGVYVAAVNRVGHEKLQSHDSGIEFWGSSFICDPFGVILAEGSADREEVLIAEVDLLHIEKTRRDWPFLRDRRIDAYSGLDRRFLDEDSL